MSFCPPEEVTLLYSFLCIERGFTMAQALNPLCEVGKHLEHALEGVMPASNSQSSFTLSVLQKREHCPAYSSPIFNLPDSKSGTIE